MTLVETGRLDHAAPAPIQFTYSTQLASPGKRAMIRALEFAGGQPRLKRLYLQNQRDPRPGETFFEAAVRLLRLDVRFDQAMLDLVPREGPVVFIANHPYGVLDGITLTWLAMKVRPDVKVLANAVLCQAVEARDNLLSIDFAPTAEARETTLASRVLAQAHLKAGGAIGIFPGGGVSAAQRPLTGPALDLPWAPFTAKMIRMSRATVVPIWFCGQNSRLFQIASHLSYTLRLSLMFHETARRMGTRLDVVTGRPIAFEDLAPFTQREDLVRELRRRTVALAPDGHRHDFMEEFTKGTW